MKLWMSGYEWLMSQMNVYMKGKWGHKDDARVVIATPSIDMLKSDGASKITSIGTINSPKLQISASGASNMNLNINS